MKYNELVRIEDRIEVTFHDAGHILGSSMIKVKVSQNDEARTSGFSAHADRDELFKWLSGLKKAPRHLFVTHGEPDAAQHFADFLREKTDWEISVPRYQDEFILD